MNTLTSSETSHLPDLCADLFAFALQLRQTGYTGAADTLKTTVGELFAKMAAAAQSARCAPADVEMAKYALTALIDEIILSSHLDIRTEWTSRPLQLEYFNEFAAGEEFYSKVESLRGSGASKAAVLEVYALAIGLGFRGKYADMGGQEKLKVLAAELTHEIQRAGGSEGNELSVHWQVEERLDEKVKSIPVWGVVAICAGVLLLLFLVFNTLLGWRIDDYSKALTTVAR